MHFIFCRFGGLHASHVLMPALSREEMSEEPEIEASETTDLLTRSAPASNVTPLLGPPKRSTQSFSPTSSHTSSTASVCAAHQLIFQSQPPT